MIRLMVCLLVLGGLAANLTAETGEMVILETSCLRVTLDATGGIRSLYDTAGDRECRGAGAASLVSLVFDGKEAQPTAMAYDKGMGRLRLVYGESGITAAVRVETKPTHLTFQLEKIDGAAPTRVNWGPFPTTVGKTIGATVGVVRDDGFALGIQSLNIQTIGGAERTDFGSRLWAYALEHDGGVKGSKIALFGCRFADALATIGEIEVAEGLPHPMLDGVWGKISPTARRSYLVCGWSESTIDEVLEFAKLGGFKYVYDGDPFQSWGHFRMDPRRFPDGDESMRRCVERATKAGIRLGAHTLTGFITTNDPYVTPVPDPRLARMGSTTLTEAIDEQATEIGIADPSAFRDRQVLATVIIGQELVQYGAVSDAAPWRLLGCTRGAFGTKPSSHEAGTDIGKLADHGYRTFYPGIENGMMDELTNRLVELFNNTGLRQISFDGLEGLSTYGYGEYARNRFVKQCFDGWRVEVINDASNLLHSAKVDIDEYRANNCRYFEDNLFPTAMGWWGLGGASLDHEATRLEDVEYLLAKAAGYDACHGMCAGPDMLKTCGYGAECLRLVRDWDEARYRGAFTATQRRKLRQKGRDFHLEPAGDRHWTLTEIRYSPFYWMCPGGGRTAASDPARQVLSFTTASEAHRGTECRVRNPFKEQPLRFEMRVAGSFDYDSADNIVLSPGVSDFRPDPSRPADAPELKVTDGRANGMPGYEIAAAYDGKERSGAIRAVAALSGPVDLRQHRGLGFWVRGDGKGELLFVELVAGGMKRQYYAPVDFMGERYFEFPLGEMCCGRYYAYDWNRWGGFANWWETLKGFDYSRVDRITVGFNAIPAGARVACVVGGIKALKELGAQARGVSLELDGKRTSFDAALPPGSYLIYDGGDAAEVRDQNFRLLDTAQIAGDRLTAPRGESVIRVSYEGDAGAAPWARLEFRCVGRPEPVIAKR
jgi:hypothetical protein